QDRMRGGWLLRGLHHFTAHVMIVLLVLHLMQVVIDGAYKAPREVNFWFGVVLLQLVLALSLTGYLLPWDQKGYWATKVPTNLAGLAPGAGIAGAPAEVRSAPASAPPLTLASLTALRDRTGISFGSSNSSSCFPAAQKFGARSSSPRW